MDSRPRKIPPGLKSKDLVGIPWRLAFALQEDGWYLRQDMIWYRSNPMPEPVRDRCTNAHEHVFLLAKKAKYFFDAVAIREPPSSGNRNRSQNHRPGLEQAFFGNVPTNIGRCGNHADGRNKHSVWKIPSQPLCELHFASYPTKLVLPCLLAGTSKEGCCAKCGAPWVRMVERERREIDLDSTVQSDKNRRRLELGMNSHKSTLGSFRKHNNFQHANPHTMRWQPGCDCHADEPVPCTILDPFMGSGTTGCVAVKRHRRFVGIELNPEYFQMAIRRIQKGERQRGLKWP
jgi:hypothetical protein